MGKKIKIKESELIKLIGTMVMEQERGEGRDEEPVRDLPVGQMPHPDKKVGHPESDEFKNMISSTEKKHGTVFNRETKTWSRAKEEPVKEPETKEPVKGPEKPPQTPKSDTQTTPVSTDTTPEQPVDTEGNPGNDGRLTEMGKKIRMKEEELFNIISKIVEEQTYSVVDDPMKGIDDKFSHQQTKQANDAKDSESHVVVDTQPDVEHYLEEEDHDMPEEWMDELEDETGVQRPMSYSPDLPDVEYSNSPMTTPAPTKTPTRTPTKTPTRPRRQDPFKVPDIKPGEEPAPKAGIEHKEVITMSESQLIDMIKNLVVETKDGKGCANTSKGCVRKRDGGYVILNNKKGGVWRKCKSKSHCEDMLDAYHANS